MPAVLSAIRIYPVMACRRVELERARLASTGLDGDRAWMVTRTDGRFLSQRSHPRLARLVPRLARGTLELHCPGLDPLVVSGAADGELREVGVWDDRMRAVDAGDPAAAWLERALGAPARLVRACAETRRYANRAYVGDRDVPVSFADGYPILVCTTASLAALNERLPVPVPMERFRPNLVLDGLEAFAEDRIRAVRIGAVVLRFVKPCTRCTVPSIDQDSGEPGTDPGPALRAFRYDAKLRGVLFGVNAIAEGPAAAEITVGTAVDVVA